MTYRIQAVGTKRKRLVVHFNRLKPCKEHPQQGGTEHNQTDDHNSDNGLTQTTEDDPERTRADLRSSNADAGNTTDGCEENDDLDDQSAHLTRTNQDRDNDSFVEAQDQGHQVPEADDANDPSTSLDGNPEHLPVGSTTTAHDDMGEAQDQYHQVPEADDANDPSTSLDGNPEHLPVGSTATALDDMGEAQNQDQAAETTENIGRSGHADHSTSEEPILTRQDRARRLPAWTQDYELT